LQSKVVAKFGGQDTQKAREVRYTVVAGFLFLRFFCPAILGPKLFSLAKEHPPMKSARAFTLVAKTLQNLANLVEFGWKEEYMKDMNTFIIDNLTSMKNFLDKISVTIVFSNFHDNIRLQR
jgi:Ras GTPase-activating protein 1